nr:type ISP restriction/modification enzyme [Parvularcula maris]
MTTVTPSTRGNWINQVENEWDDLLPLADKKVKSARPGAPQKAVFKLYGNGINTARDEWVVRDDATELLTAANVAYHLIDYADADEPNVENGMKWSRNLKRKRKRNLAEKLDKKFVETYEYRPFRKRNVYLSPLLIDEQGYWKKQGCINNKHVAFPAAGSFRCLASDRAMDFHFIGDARVVSRYRYNDEGQRIDNITDWALRKFQERYGKEVTKDAIFAYCYAVLHDPVYRETYAINLKRELPRIPFYEGFERWCAWGQTLLDLHIGYEEVAPHPLTRIDEPNPRRAEGTAPKVILRSDHGAGTITLDADTKLTGVPEEAWDYVLGNRTAIDWVLDQHKEKKIRDETVRRLFDTYRFADHKERVIDLLARVTTVSIETVAITNAMAAAKRD